MFLVSFPITTLKTCSRIRMCFHLFVVSNVLHFLFNSIGSFSIVVPEVQRRRFWWPILTNIASASFCFGRKGQTGIVLSPSFGGFNCGLCVFYALKRNRSCPVRLAYTTVDSYFGKLGAPFKSLGRVGGRNSSLGLGNLWLLFHIQLTEHFC